MPAQVAATEERARPPAPTPEPRSRAADDATAKPAALFLLALLGGAGYALWRWAARRREQAEGAEQEAVVRAQQTSAKGWSKGAAAGTSGRAPPVQAAHARGPQSNPRRQPPPPPQHHHQKPKSQKQLRKEAKAANKAAKEQASRDAESAALASVIAQRAKARGLGPAPPPEPPKQYTVDYGGVAEGYGKIVEWQETGKKNFDKAK